MTSFRSALLTILFVVVASHAAGSTCEPDPIGAERRILAMAPHLVEVLFAIGAEREIVGVSRYSNYPESAKLLPRVGGYKGIHVEAALRTRPTLAFALDRTVEGVTTLGRLGVPVVVSHPETIRNALDEIVRIADRLCRGDQGRALRSQLLTRLETIASKRPEVSPRVFYEVWHEPLKTVGGSSFIHDAIREAGGSNIFSDHGTEIIQASIEAVLRLKPEIIVLSGEPEHIERRRAFWQQWLPPEKTRIVSVDDDLLQRPGPRVVDGVAILQDLMLDGGER